MAKAALDCAHRTSTASSCAFCEQGGHLAAPSSSYTGRGAKPAGLVSDRTRSYAFLEFFQFSLKFLLIPLSSHYLTLSNQLLFIIATYRNSSSSSPAHSLLMSPTINGDASLHALDRRQPRRVRAVSPRTNPNRSRCVFCTSTTPADQGGIGTGQDGARVLATCEATLQTQPGHGGGSDLVGGCGHGSASKAGGSPI
jgi:hypothetical protein